jgi:hypothetical protein
MYPGGNKSKVAETLITATFPLDGTQLSHLSQTIEE